MLRTRAPLALNLISRQRLPCLCFSISELFLRTQPFVSQHLCLKLICSVVPDTSGSYLFQTGSTNCVAD